MAVRLVPANKCAPGHHLSQRDFALSRPTAFAIGVYVSRRENWWGLAISQFAIPNNEIYDTDWFVLGILMRSVCLQIVLHALFHL